MKNIINLTPHDIHFHKADGSIVTIKASGTVARANTVSTPDGAIDGIPVINISHGDVTGLPAPAPDTIFIVSTIVASAVPKSRTDVFVPNDFIRDDKGNIIGAKSLGRVL